jgi:UMF1 family MFS transporter
VRHSASNVWRTLRKLRDHRNVALFLLARMIFADGKGAILIIGGVYVAGVMGWELIDMLAYGVLLSTFAIVGGLTSGALDEWLGAKTALMLELALTLICLIVMLSMSREAMFFFIPVDPAVLAWSGPVFQTAPELAYVAASMLIAVSITAAFASSRTLMTQLSPPGMEGELFGLYALSGSATAWLGPLMVGVFTAAFASQTIGFASIAILLIGGLAVLSFVRSPQRA